MNNVVDYQILLEGLAKTPVSNKNIKQTEIWKETGLIILQKLKIAKYSDTINIVWMCS